MRLNRKLTKFALAGALVGSAFAPASCNIPPGLIDAVVNAVVTNSQTQNASGLLGSLSPGGLVDRSGDASSDESQN